MIKRLYNLTLAIGLAICSYYAIGANLGVARLPAGVGVISFGATCPLYSVEASGASLANTGQYINLYTALGGASSPWGLPDGSHFTAPPMRGRIPRGAGSATDGNGGTAVARGVYQADATAVNGLHDTGHTHNMTGATLSAFVAGPYDGMLSVNNTTVVTASGTANLAGDTETRPKSYGVLYCVYY